MEGPETDSLSKADRPTSGELLGHGRTRRLDGGEAGPFPASTVFLLYDSPAAILEGSVQFGCQPLRAMAGGWTAQADA